MGNQRISGASQAPRQAPAVEGARAAELEAPAQGNAARAAELAAACGPIGPQATSPTGVRVSRDPALDPLYDAVNHSGLDVGDRAQLMLNYRNRQLADADLFTLNAMRNNEADQPLWATGDERGMHQPLYTRLAGDPQMQALMTDLTDRILAGDSETLDIQQIWSDTQAAAMSGAGETAPNAATNHAALQAMATLSNYYKFEDGALPPELAGQLPEGLWDRIRQAGDTLAHSTSPNAAVMSQGVQAGPGNGDFTADNNFHFFSHAFLTADLVHTHGVSPAMAEAVSGYVGSQYELLDYSLREGSGNSGIKDILMNAEGASFGTALMRDPCRALPGQMDGPPVEDRSIASHEGDLPADAQGVVDQANDLGVWNMLGESLRGVFGLEPEVEIPERPAGSRGPVTPPRAPSAGG